MKPFPTLEEVLARVREAFFSHSPATFGVHVKAGRMYWRDTISGELGAIATLPTESEPVVTAVLAELASLRSAPLQKKPPRQEERRSYVAARTGTAHGRRAAARARNF